MLAKAEQVGLAVKLEMTYSKAQILEMYLNAIYYGDGRWGIQAASEGFFAKAPVALDWAEASLVAGLPQAPTTYNPTEHFSTARIRQRDVLARLVATGALNRAQADAAHSELASLQS